MSTKVRVKKRLNVVLSCLFNNFPSNVYWLSAKSNGMAINVKYVCYAVLWQLYTDLMGGYIFMHG